MRKPKRALYALLITALAAGGVAVGTTAAQAHTGTLSTSSVCNTDGSQTITYSGATTSVPTTGPGHTATLTVGEILPAGSTVTPLTQPVVGNASYHFTQTIPAGSTATSAQATAFLKWGDGAVSDPIGKVTLDAGCVKPTPKDAAFTVSVKPGTCTTPGSLQYGTTSFVTVTGTKDGTTGPGSYSVVATATAGHAFADGKTSQTLSGSIPGTSTTGCTTTSPPVVADAAFDVTTTPGTCTTPGTLKYGAETNVTVTGTADGTPGPGSYSLVVSAVSGHTFPNGSVSTTLTGTIPGLSTSGCTTPPPTTLPDASFTVSVTPATCTTPGALTYGTPVNATVTGTPNGQVGPGSYSVVATATSGHTFADGRTTTTLTGTLAGTNAAACTTTPPTTTPPATTPPVATPPATTTPPSGVQGVGGTATPTVTETATVTATPSVKAAGGSSNSGSGSSGAGSGGTSVNANSDTLAFTGTDTAEMGALGMSGLLFLLTGTAFLITTWKRRKAASNS